jgi:hypothetical protein
MNNNTAWLIAFVGMVIIIAVGVYFYFKNKKSSTPIQFANIPRGINVKDKNIVIYEPGK